jgi:hypothetical protein
MIMESNNGLSFEDHPTPDPGKKKPQARGLRQLIHTRNHASIRQQAWFTKNQ